MVEWRTATSSSMIEIGPIRLNCTFLQLRPAIECGRTLWSKPTPDQLYESQLFAIKMRAVPKPKSSPTCTDKAWPLAPQVRGTAQGATGLGEGRSRATRTCVGVGEGTDPGRKLHASRRPAAPWWFANSSAC